MWFLWRGCRTPSRYNRQHSSLSSKAHGLPPSPESAAFFHAPSQMSVVAPGARWWGPWHAWMRDSPTCVWGCCDSPTRGWGCFGARKAAGAERKGGRNERTGILGRGEWQRAQCVWFQDGAPLRGAGSAKKSRQAGRRVSPHILVGGGGGRRPLRSGDVDGGRLNPRRRIRASRRTRVRCVHQWPV